MTSAAALLQLVDLGAVMPDSRLERIEPALDQFPQVGEPLVHLPLGRETSFARRGNSGEDVGVQDANPVVQVLQTSVDAPDVGCQVTLSGFDSVKPAVRFALPILEAVKPAIGFAMPVL